jgi:hypothetical protein
LVFTDIGACKFLKSSNREYKHTALLKRLQEQFRLISALRYFHLF